MDIMLHNLARSINDNSSMRWRSIHLIITIKLMKKHFNSIRTFWNSSLYLVLFVCLGFCVASCAAQVETEDGVVVQNYVPPPWAPPYDNVSSVRYYYLPDYGMYYDVWDHEFWYQGPDGDWIFSVGPPPAYAGVDFSGAFIVLIDRDIDRPWMNHGYYRDNYPRHGYDQYRDIVVHNRIVTNIEPNHELVPRAFNENNNRVTFMQKPVEPQTAPGNVAPPHPTTYHHVVHEVPMKSITPSMPQASRGLNYGGGYTKGNAGASRGATPKGGGGKR